MPDRKYMSVALPSAKISKIDTVNKEFDHVKIYTFGVGANRNYSYVSKSELDKAIPSLNYLPVVGHLIEEYDADGNVTGRYFGGHDCTVTDDLKVKMITVPYGVVIADSAQYETVEEYGQQVEYLTTEAYLWTGRYPEMKDAIYSDETWYGESAEISFAQWRPWSENSLYTELLDVNFSALCLLGKSDDPEKHTEPCFQSARVEPMDNSTFALDGAQFSQLMGEMREQLAFSLENKDSHQKGGSGMTQNERDAIFAEFSLTPSDVDFKLTEEMSAEELRAKLEAFKAAHQTAEPEGAIDGEQFAAQPGQPEGGDPEQLDGQQSLFSMTYRQKNEAICEAVRTFNKTECDAQGRLVKEVYCYLNDFDDEFAYFCASIYTADNYEDKHYKCGYTIGEDGKATMSADPQEVFLKWLTAEEVQKIEADKNQLNELVQFKQDVEEKEFSAKRDELLGRFNDVSGLEEFSAIKDELAERKTGSIEDIELKLFALRGKSMKVEKPTAGMSRVGIDHEDHTDDDDGYGGLLSRQKRK